MALLDFLQGLHAVLDGLHLVIAVAQNAQATPDDDLLVVDDQYPGAHSAAEKLTSLWLDHLFEQREVQVV